MVCFFHLKQHFTFRDQLYVPPVLNDGPICVLSSKRSRSVCFTQFECFFLQHLIGFFFNGTAGNHMASSIPEVLWIRVLNEYLSFDTTRCYSRYECSPWLHLNRYFKDVILKNANRQLKVVCIENETGTRQTCTRPQLCSKELSLVHTVSYLKLTSVGFLCLTSLRSPFPSNVTTLELNMQKDAGMTSLFMDLSDFVKQVPHLKHLKCSSTLDNIATSISGDRFAQFFSKSNPLQCNIQIGDFVTLSPNCPNLNPPDEGYRLRWVNQCPLDNCTIKFCWGDLADVNYCNHCWVQKPTIIRPCFCSPFRMVCVVHLQQYFVFREGHYMCKACTK